MGVDLEDEHLGAGLAGDHGDEQPDRTAADDEDLLARRELAPPTSWTATAVGSTSAASRSDDLVREPDEDP